MKASHSRRLPSTDIPPGALPPFPTGTPSFVLESASDGMIGLDSEGRIKLWNSGARRIFGFTRAEILGSPVSRLLPKENARGMARLLARLRSHPWIEYGEASCIKRGSLRVDVAFTVVPERSLFPNRDGILLIVHDITARKELERTLLRKVKRYESAEQLARMGSWEWDVSTDTLTWSEEFYHLLGLERSLRRSTLKRLLLRIRAEDREGFMAGIRKTLKERVPFECRYGLRRSDGSVLEVFSRARLITGPGRSLRLVGISQDLRKGRGPAGMVRTLSLRARRIQSRGLFLARAATLLFSTFDHEEALLKTVKATVPHLADRCVVDLIEPDGSIRRLQGTTVDGGRRGFGTGRVRRERLPSFPGGAPDRVRSTGDYELHPAVPPAKLAKILPGSDALALRPDPMPSLLFLPLHSRQGMTGVMTLVQSESKRRFETADLQTAQRLAQLMSLALEHCRLYADVLREMKELLKRKQELAHLNRELEGRVAQRTSQLREALNDMESFARTAAHDLRAPLRGISGLTQALVEDVGGRLGAEAGDLTSRIQDSCARMEALIRDVLAYSRASHLEIALEPVDPAAVVEMARHELETDPAGRRAEIVAETPFPKVLAHPGLLLQAILNLLENAVKFVAPGVRPIIRISSERREERVRLWIVDNGIGIAPEHLDRLFKAFERLHPREDFPGTGLGLAIVRRSLERMGGQAGVECPQSGGSRFWIELREAAGGV